MSSPITGKTNGRTIECLRYEAAKPGIAGFFVAGNQDDCLV
ncbi:hypothetical protein [Hoeflea sp. TYP-13]